MNIYDCFMYFDEDLLLDLRLNILDKFVKKFVIAEATYTHNGSKKKLNFDINKFQKFKEKINYIVVDKQPENILDMADGDAKDKRNEKIILNGMARDNFQRENLANGIKEAEENDLIIISDLDEIPNLNKLETSDVKNNIIIFEQKMFYYKFNLFYENYTWFGSKAIRNKQFKSPQWLRNIKGKKYPKWRIDTIFSNKKYTNIKFIKDGGWHFTNIRTPKDLHFKFSNFAHHFDYEMSNLKVIDLEKMVRDKKVLYDHSLDKTKNKWKPSSQLKRIDQTYLPKYLLKNKSKYKMWLDE